jgi:hypothetical protein
MSTEYFINEIRERLKEIYPKLQGWLLENRPELAYIYETYYQQAMYNPDPYIASEYAYRIFRAYLSIKGIQP